MMRTTSKPAKILAVLSAAMALGTSIGMAQTPTIVYDNSTTDLNQVYGVNGTEFGDEITLAGTARTVTDFKFEYFLAQSAASSGATVQVNFYNMTGPTVSRTASDGSTVQVPSPGSTPIYSSPVLTLGTGYQTAEISGISVPVGNDFTWTVTFNGVPANTSFGLRLFDPPTIGSSFADFWQNSGGTWNTYLFNNGATPANFAARVTAVPEPTTFALALLAGFGWVGYLGFKRRSS
jgi:hypothetical protein